MPDIYIDFCQNCGGHVEFARKNGEVLMRCKSCGRTVVICREDEMTADHNGRINVIPYAKGIAAAEKWNAKEEANGR